MRPCIYSGIAGTICEMQLPPFIPVPSALVLVRLDVDTCSKRLPECGSLYRSPLQYGMAGLQDGVGSPTNVSPRAQRVNEHLVQTPCSSASRMNVVRLVAGNIKWLCGCCLVSGRWGPSPS